MQMQKIKCVTTVCLHCDFVKYFEHIGVLGTNVDQCSRYKLATLAPSVWG